MTVFEQELKKLFGGSIRLSNVRFVGNACYGRLTDTIRAKIQFIAGNISNQYNALKITLINRNEGNIDSICLRFIDLWGEKHTRNLRCSNGVYPHLWDDSGEVGWYVYQPTANDYKVLLSAAEDYLELFCEPVQEQTMSHKFC